MDRVEERHLLFRCLLEDREVIATGTRHPWNPRITGSGDSDLSIRVYVFFGYDSPDRSTQMTAQHVAACISSFADNSHRVRRRVGEAEQQLVQLGSRRIFSSDSLIPRPCGGSAGTLTSRHCHASSAYRKCRHAHSHP